ncbi:MAG TPA: hypothetical protein VJ728_02655 [Candidatus Binataceae bacterium]|nr:hypothetical protein [Candidatus Binataceae bacterium]
MLEKLIELRAKAGAFIEQSSDAKASEFYRVLPRFGVSVPGELSRITQLEKMTQQCFEMTLNRTPFTLAQAVDFLSQVFEVDLFEPTFPQGMNLRFDPSVVVALIEFVAGAFQ